MPDSGILRIRVFTSRGELPIENAAVSVVRRGAGGKERLLAVRLSDRSGNLPPLTIETPKAGLSNTPNAATPFSLCDVWVEHPGYQRLLIQNVQLFPGITSTQSLPLIPLPEGTALPEGRVNILPQDL